jgi:hypothetical protein
VVSIYFLLGDVTNASDGPHGKFLYDNVWYTCVLMEYREMDVKDEHLSESNKFLPLDNGSV